MLRLKAVVLLIALLTYGCAWLDRSERQQIVGEYEIGWDDIETNRCITESVDEECNGCHRIVVGSYVYAIGHNDRFIIAKQHPNSSTTITRYFIVDINSNRKDNNKGIYGPLDEDEFEALSNRLKIQNLNFDLHFPERPL